jgi:undecaprenyl pyrophosphate phosphatase UppP
MELFVDLFQLGAVGTMCVVFWKQLIKKDKKSYQMIEQMNGERREMYVNMRELIIEVTSALVNKNHTDDKMAEAVKKYTEQLREFKEILRDQERRQS